MAKTLYDNLVIVIRSANEDLENNKVTQEWYNSKMKSTIKKMDLFVKRKAITQEQYDELKGMMKL